ncbi:MAG: hypothetical protein WCJ71_04145 [Candidatus Omnitrophota bacterium]
MGKKKRLKLERAKQLADEKKTHIPVPFWAVAGVVIFGTLLILSSLVHMHKLAMEKELYEHYYSYLPVGLIGVRYAFSWFQRILGILAGVGLLVRKEIARKLAFFIGGFTILTVYWKHPYEAVRFHTQYLDQQMGHLLSWTGTGVTFSSLTPFAVAALIACDVIFWAIFFYFFTRPPVKCQFRPGA